MIRRLLGLTRLHARSEATNAAADTFAATSQRTATESDPRTYSITVVARKESRGGSTIEISGAPWATKFRHDGSAFLVQMPVQSERLQDAYREACALATSFLQLLGTDGVGYRIGDHDERVELEVTEEGPIGPRLENFTQNPFAKAGEPTFMPVPRTIISTHELRVNKRVHGDEFVTIFEGRERWPNSLRYALALYWEGQCAYDPNVKFALTVGSLEALVDADNPRRKHFEELSRVDKRIIKDSISTALKATGKASGPEIESVRESVLNLDKVKTSPRFAEYLNARLHLGGRDSFHAVTSQQIGDLLRQRGRYIHAGRPGDDELLGQRWDLIYRVGRCLRIETSRYV